MVTPTRHAADTIQTSVLLCIMPALATDSKTPSANFHLVFPPLVSVQLSIDSMVLSNRTTASEGAYPGFSPQLEKPGLTIFGWGCFVSSVSWTMIPSMVMYSIFLPSLSVSYHFLITGLGFSMDLLSLFCCSAEQLDAINTRKRIAQRLMNVICVFMISP